MYYIFVYSRIYLVHMFGRVIRRERENAHVCSIYAKSPQLLVASRCAVDFVVFIRSSSLFMLLGLFAAIAAT